MIIKILSQKGWSSDEMMADLSEGFSLLTLANNLRDVSVLFCHFNNGGLMEF
uniref:Uncharacterized protein n=1 Tax=Vitis vinifera TaxID=29760 RepID=F6HKA2_VITVI